MRIRSLLPSATEIVAQLGLLDSLVGVSQECDWPPEVRELPEELQPDLILTQNLCAVCAVSADNVGELCATDAEVVALDAHTLTEIEERILSLADLLGVSARGLTVVAEMEAKIAAVRARVTDAPTRSVFVAEWLEPPYAAGHWIPEMVELAGGEDVLGRAGAPSFRTTWAEALGRGP